MNPHLTVIDLVLMQPGCSQWTENGANLYTPQSFYWPLFHPLLA